ncbi:MAG: hypothetical protein HY067_15445 [Betaproteobacteria bacterium]|nr:hypothetical protein [Betaproteobacteria bacterium]
MDREITSSRASDGARAAGVVYVQVRRVQIDPAAAADPAALEFAVAVALGRQLGMDSPLPLQALAAGLSLSLAANLPPAWAATSARAKQ